MARVAAQWSELAKLGRRRDGSRLVGFFLRSAFARGLGCRRRLVGRLENDQTGCKHTATVLVEVDHRMMLVHFDERAGPVIGLHDPIAFRPSFHRHPTGYWRRSATRETLPARLAASAAAAAAVAAVSTAAADSASGLGTRF